MSRRSLVAAAALAGVLLSGGAAHADLTRADAIIFDPGPIIWRFPTSGVVRGQITFYQNQGNYCPSTRDCTGATYLESAYHTNNPVANVKVYVREGETIIGQGTTDDAGNFAISWWADHPVWQGNFIWQAEQKDNRFAIRTDSGGAWVMWTWPFDMTWGTTGEAPQQLGNFTWGDATSPHAIANLYDGAQRVWRDNLAYSNLMLAVFSGLQIRAFDQRTDASYCGTSCADGPANVVWMDRDANTPFVPLARVMHEVGHIASYRANPSWSRYDASDDDWGGNGWNLTGAEWGHLAFEEALATSLGDQAIYWPWATNPATCYGTGVCWNMLEPNQTACGTDGARIPLNLDRALWDIFDSVNDGTDTTSHDVWGALDAMGRFASGTGNNQINERFAPWPDNNDRDARASNDFSAVFNTQHSSWPGHQFDNNCGRIGD